MASKYPNSGSAHVAPGLREMLRFALLLAGLAVAITFMLTVQLLPSRYELHEGDVSPQNIRAPRRIQYVSAIETKAERERAANSVQEVYIFDPGVAVQQRNKLTAALQTIGGIRANAALAPDAKKSSIRKALEIDLPDEDLNQLLRMDDPRWLNLATNTPRVLGDVLNERIPADRLRNLRQELPPRFAALTVDQDRTVAVDLVYGMARVNYAPNPADTERLRKDAQDAVAPVVKTVENGEIILRDGDVVRATDVEKLEALGLRNPAVDLHAIVASGLLVCLVVVMLGGYILVFEPSLLKHERRLWLVALVMLVTVLAAKAILPGHPYWAYPFPIALVAMLLTTLLNAHLALMVSVLLSLLVAVVSNGSLEVAAVGIVGSVLGILGVRRSDRLHSYFIAGAMVGVGVFAVILSFRLMSKEEDLANLALMAGLSAVNGLLSASLTVGTFSLLGRIFGITTGMQLLELSDPTQPLLRRLLNEAPGTYHHSIMVGNLAERAAERVGADPLLVRVGAYYHDVGKLARPYFFIENQFDGKNVHDTLDPQTSARIVATHVRDGMELAEKYKLPPRVREFISEHHGTRVVTYFYNRAKCAGKGDVDPAPYTYPGPRPRSKEAGIVMLADSVEAVVRSAQDHSAENVEALVRKVVDERMLEGQLADCDLTIRDLEELKKAFMSVLLGMYHPRIEYPPAEVPSLERIRSPRWAQRANGRIPRLMPNKPQPETPLVVDWDVTPSLEGFVPGPLLESALAEALSGRKVGASLAVGLTITDDIGIQDLNRRYREVDAPTDVLSFPLLEYLRPEQPADVFPLPPGEPLSLGDIAISYPRAVEQADSYGHSLERELAFLAVHGAMHLLGYDHLRPEDEALMRREEEAVLRRLGLER